MATAVTHRNAPFTFIWYIENFSKLTYVHIKSPKFVAGSLSKAQWCIQIEEFVDLCCWLTTEENSSAEKAGIYVEYSLLDVDGSPLVTKKSGKEGLFCFLLNDKDFFQRKTEFIPNSTLTFRLQMWKKDQKVSTSDICYTRSRLETYTGSILWSIGEFIALKSSTDEDFTKLAVDERKVYVLKRFNPKLNFVTFLLYLNKHPKSEDVCVIFLIEKGRDYGYRCVISILDVNGEVIASGVQQNRSHFKQLILKFPKLISTSKLLEDKNLFLPNDTLLLRCSFEILTGVISSKIEYCSPNAFPVIEDDLIKELKSNDSFSFEEQLIKEVHEHDLVDNSMELKSDMDSYKDSCTLKAALMHMHSEAILSDISLRIGERLYPVHKNILYCRCPVFTKILSNETTDNIIEITEIDENTLYLLLQYIYTDTIDLQLEDALNLYNAASSNSLLDLKNKCSEFLILNLSKTIVWDVFCLASKYKDEKLKTSARDFMSRLGNDFELEEEFNFDAGSGKEIEIDDDLNFDAGFGKDIEVDDDLQFDSVSGNDFKLDDNVNFDSCSGKDIQIDSDFNFHSVSYKDIEVDADLHFESVSGKDFKLEDNLNFDSGSGKDIEVTDDLDFESCSGKNFNSDDNSKPSTRCNLM